MPLHNSATGYGSLTKAFHWLTVLAFAFQFISANIMTRMTPGESALGSVQDDYYNWHKSIGLLALLVAAGRIWARRQGSLPAWAPVLTGSERAFIHRAEQVLYAAMFVMPISGFIYVMAGGYGVRFFGQIDMPNPMGAWPWLAFGARWVHVIAAWALLATMAAHIGLVLRHTLVLRDGLLRRMLPGGK